MRIVLFRHGIAEDPEASAGAGLPDSERALTGKGERRTREAASGLMSLLPDLAVIGASPYLRARQTADIIAGVYGGSGREVKREILDDMRPGGSPSGICRWLEQHVRDDVAALVGHEPDLSGLTARFTTGEAHDFTRFKKAGACLIEFPSVPARGGGELVWLLTPAVLRRLVY